MFIYYSKTYPSRQEASAAGVQWKRAETPDNPIGYDVSTAAPWVLRLKLQTDSRLPEDAESDGFRPCDPPEED